MQSTVFPFFYSVFCATCTIHFALLRFLRILNCFCATVLQYKNQDFLLTTYEMIKKSDGRTRTSNMIFLPPLGNRFFNLHTLLPYSVEASAVLVSQCCNLWKLLLDMYKIDHSSVYLEVNPGKLEIEEE